MKDLWERRNNIFSLIFILVLVVHLGLLMVKILRPFDGKKNIAAQDLGDLTKPMKVTIIDPKDVPKRMKQIVQSEDGQKIKPKDSAFLGEKDRSFDRQTVARKVGVFNKGGKGGAASEAKPQPKSANKNPPGLPKNLKLSDLGSAGWASNPYESLAKDYSEKKKAGAASGDPTSRGISSTNDYLPDVPLGDLTHLNTVEFKYYGFYHRIRQKLEQFWGRSIQEKAQALLKSGRTIASDNLVTALVVVMDEAGDIVDIKVRGSSGVKELDDAAIESFNDAGPFPNPPKDLVSNGRVTIEWGFVVSS